MKIEVTYPKPAPGGVFLRVFRTVMLWLFLAASVACPIVNICVGGRAWSIVVLWSVYTASALVFMPLVERSLLTQGVRLLFNVSILLVLIDRLLAPGWAIIAVPAMVAGGLLVLSVILFTDLRHHRGGSIPLLISLLAAVVAAALYNLLSEKLSVAMAVLGAVAFLLLIAVAAAMKGKLIAEAKKYFHIK